MANRSVRVTAHAEEIKYETLKQPVVKVAAAFDRRCIPAAGVVPRSNTTGIFPRLALAAGRITVLGATRDFHHGLLAAATGRDAVRRPRRTTMSYQSAT